MAPRGGKRKGAGAPRAPYDLLKIPINVKLPRWLLAWMATQDESRAVQIEDALCKTHGLIAPTDAKK